MSFDILVVCDWSPILGFTMLKIIKGLLSKLFWSFNIYQNIRTSSLCVLIQHHLWTEMWSFDTLGWSWQFGLLGWVMKTFLYLFNLTELNKLDSLHLEVCIHALPCASSSLLGSKLVLSLFHIYPRFYAIYSSMQDCWLFSVIFTMSGWSGQYGLQRLNTSKHSVVV